MMKAVYVGDRAFRPSKLVCIRRHPKDCIQAQKDIFAKQLVVFHKPNSSITNQLISFHGEPLHYETDMCFLIRKGQYYAVGLGLDLTKRELRSQLAANGLPWERANAFDGSAVFSRFLPVNSLDISSLSLELLINCVRVQCISPAELSYPPDIILRELASYTSLEDGDIVMIGMPKVGGQVVARGDIFLVRLKAGEKTILEVEWQAE